MFKLLIIFVTSVIFCSSQGIAKDDLDNQLDELKTHYFVGIWVSDAGRIEIKIVDRINDYEIKKYPAKKYFDDAAFDKIMMYKDRIGKICIDSNYISSSSIMKLSDCKNIEKIYFGKNYNDNLRNVFSGMINLREIEVGHDAQLSILTLSYLAVTNKKLIYVDISNSKIIDKDIEGLSGMKTLEYLHLQNTSITDKAIELLSTQYHPILKVLDVNETAITDKAIPFFAKMKGLENLQINKTNISKDGFRKLEKLMPNCEIVYGVIVPN